DGPAYRQQQDLAQGMGDAMRLARVLDVPKMIEQQPQAGRFELERRVQLREGKPQTPARLAAMRFWQRARDGSWRSSESGRPMDSASAQSVNRVNPSSEP